MNQIITGKTWAMTDDEKRQFNHMQNDITAIKQEIARQGLQVDRLCIALMGSEIAKDGGLVERIKNLEHENEELREQIEAIKTDKVKSDLYIKWIWALVSGLVSMIFGYVMTLIFKK